MKGLIERFELRPAWELLNRIESQFSGVWTPYENYRLLANRGHVKRLEGDSREAATLFLRAKARFSDSEDAAALEPMAYHLLGQNPKAHSLADALRSKYPESERIMNIWITTASPDVSAADLEGAIPEHHRGDSEVALALAARAMQHADFILGEKYARRAVSAKPTWMDAKRVLADTLMLAEERRLSYGAAEPDASKVGESLWLYSEVLPEFEKYAPNDLIIPIRLNIAAALVLLDDPKSAFAHLQIARSRAPRDPQVLVRYARLQAQIDGISMAINSLRDHVPNQQSAEVDILFAHLVAQQGTKQGIDEAISVIERRRPEFPQMPDDLRVECISTLAEAYSIDKRFTEAESLVKGDFPLGVPTPEREVLLSHIAYNADRIDEAQEYAKQAHNAVMEMISERSAALPIVARTAIALQKARLPALALELWLHLYVPGTLGKELDQLVNSAQASGKFHITLDMCRALREKGHFVRKYMEVEIATLERISPQRTVELLSELLEHVVEDDFRLELRLHRSYLALNLNLPELVDTDPSHLPSPADVKSAQMGRAAVIVLQQNPDPMVAVRYAYGLFRRLPDELDSHMAVIQSVGIPLGRKVDFAPIELVAAGAAVEYAEYGVTRWLIVEDLEKPSPTRDEHPLDDPLVRVMLGHRVGDEVTLRPAPLLRSATVTKIISKYQYRASQCLAELENRFPDQSFLFSMRAPEVEPGKPDIQPLLDFLKDRQADQQTRDAWYLNNPVSPLVYVVVKGGASAFDGLVEFLVAGRLPYRAFHGPADDIGSTSVLLSNPCYMDVSAAAILCVLFQVEETVIAKFLRGLSGRVIIPETVWLDILKACHATIGSSPQREVLGRYTAVLKSMCPIEPSSATRTIDPGTAKQLRELFGSASLGALEHAKRTATTLWADDAGLAGCAAESGVRRIWTQAMLQFALNERTLSQEEFGLLSARLLQHRVEFTACSVHTLIAAANRCNWDVDQPLLRDTLHSLNDPRLNQQSVVGVLFQFMKHVVQARQGFGLETPLLVHVLTQMGRLPGGHRLIQTLAEQADMLFGVDVFGAETFKDHCEAWLKGPGGKRIILP